MSTFREALSTLPDAVFADLLESDDAYLVVLDLPGATAATTDVRVDRGRIRIEAHREKATPESFRYVREDRSLFLDVELPLPPEASGSDATASMEDGVLEIRLPKQTAVSGQRIPIEDA